MEFINKHLSVVAVHSPNTLYTHKKAQVVTSLQTSCYKSVHKLSTSCVSSVFPSLL